MTEFPATTNEAHSDGRIAAFGGHTLTTNPYRHWPASNAIRKAWDDGFNEGKALRDKAANGGTDQ